MTDKMKASENGIRIIKKFEGRAIKPYRDSVGYWTVGFGHLLYPEQLRLEREQIMSFALKPEDNRVFTEEEMEFLLRIDLLRFERAISKNIIVPLGQNQFDALISFIFNVGIGALQRSGLRMKLNRKEYFDASLEFLKWNKAGGKVLNGLTTRRKIERELFLT